MVKLSTGQHLKNLNVCGFQLRKMKIKFDDWIFMQDNRVTAVNRATMISLNIEVTD